MKCWSPIELTIGLCLCISSKPCIELHPMPAFYLEHCRNQQPQVPGLWLLKVQFLIAFTFLLLITCCTMRAIQKSCSLLQRPSIRNHFPASMWIPRWSFTPYLQQENQFHLFMYFPRQTDRINCQTNALTASTTRGIEFVMGPDQRDQPWVLWTGTLQFIYSTCLSCKHQHHTLVFFLSDSAGGRWMLLPHRTNTSIAEWNILPHIFFISGEN